MRPFRSIRAQLAASVGLLVLLIVATAGVVIVAQMDSRDRAVLDEQLQARADRVGEDLDKVVGDHGASTDEYGDLLAGSESLVRVIVDGVVVAERGEVPEEEIPAPTEAGLTTVVIDGEEWRSLVLADGTGVEVQVLQSLASLNQRLTANAWLVTIVTTIATLLAIAGGWLLASVILQPLRALTRGAQRIRDAHHIEDRMPQVSAPAEIAELSDTLNDMLERLERSTNAIRRFTADAGHELRTPLAGAAAGLEILQRNPELPTADRACLLESARADVGATRYRRARVHRARAVRADDLEASRVQEAAPLRRGPPRGEVRRHLHALPRLPQLHRRRNHEA